MMMMMIAIIKESFRSLLHSSMEMKKYSRNLAPKGKNYDFFFIMTFGLP